MDWATVALWVGAVLLMAVGFAGLVLPALPGPPLIFLGVLVAAWAEDFRYLGAWSLGTVGALALLAVAVDFFASAFGARRYGASKQAVLGATLGAVVGIFFGVIGFLVGPFVGAVLGELSVRRHLGAAGRAGFGATIGLVLGTAAKLALGFAMIGVLLVARLL